MLVQSPFHRTVIATFVTALACPFVIAVGDGDLTALMPEKTLLYVGLSGPEATKQARSETALGKTLADPEIQRFRKDLYTVLDMLLRRQAQKEGNLAVYEPAERVIRALVSHPVAFALQDIGLNPQSGPSVQALLVIDAGDAAESIAKDVDALLTSLNLPVGLKGAIDDRQLNMLPLPVPGGLYYGAEEGRFIVAVSQDAVRYLRTAVKAATPDSLKTSKFLRSARERIGGDSATRSMMIHLDLKRTFTTVNQFLPLLAQGNAKRAKEIQEGLQAFGAERLISWTMEMHHREAGFLSSAYLQIDQAAQPDEKPATVTDAELALIPQEANWGTVAHVDLAQVLKSVLAILALLEPTAGPKFETWLADVKETCGVDLRTDVIDRLGHSFVVYDHPTHNAGAMLLQGVVVSLDPEDPPGLIATMSKLTKCIDDKVSNANIVPSRMTYRGQEVHYVGFDTPAPLAPACMVYKDRLYCAVYPQVLAAVVDFLQAPDHADHSLLVNGDFSRGRKILGGSTSITWSDPRPTFEGLYSILLPLATMGVGAAKGEGIDVSPASVPTLRAATQHMFGQVSAISSDERGRLWRCYGPLPVPLPSMGSADAIVPAAMLTSILLPSLSRARELSKRLVCASNLKGIGTTMKIAVMDDSKSGVPTIQSLLDSGAITAKMLECPSGGEANYIVVPYTAEQIDHSRPNQVWMYEPIDNHLDGGNILFADGTVRFVRGEEYERLIRSIGSND